MLLVANVTASSRWFVCGCLMLLSLHIICGKYARTDDLFDFYAGNPQGLHVFSLLKAVVLPSLSPPALHIIYVGDCADLFAEDTTESWLTAAISYQCLINDEDIDTCRYSLQADDRDLDYVRDNSCANAVLSRSQVVNPSPSLAVPVQSVPSIILIPFHCGCHDFAHPLQVATELLTSSSELQALVFAFNCKNPNSISLLSARIDTNLRKLHPFLYDDAAPWTTLIGHCDWNIRNFDLLEAKMPTQVPGGNCSKESTLNQQNVLAVAFGMQMLPHLSPCLSALNPQLSLSPLNGSIIYCDVPFPVKFSWLHHSAWQPLAHSHRFNAGILDFKGAHLGLTTSVRLGLSGQHETVLLKCSDVLPSAPLLVHLDANFEVFSTNDDFDGENYNLLYTLATPCSMPPAQIPDHIRAALHDAAIFTWNETNSIRPPILHVSFG